MSETAKQLFEALSDPLDFAVGLISLGLVLLFDTSSDIIPLVEPGTASVAVASIALGLKKAVDPYLIRRKRNKGREKVMRQIFELMENYTSLSEEHIEVSSRLADIRDLLRVGIYDAEQARKEVEETVQEARAARNRLR